MPSINRPHKTNEADNHRLTISWVACVKLGVCYSMLPVASMHYGL